MNLNILSKGEKEKENDALNKELLEKISELISSPKLTDMEKWELIEELFKECEQAKTEEQNRTHTR